MRIGNRLISSLLLVPAVLAACAETSRPPNPPASKANQVDSFFSILDHCQKILTHSSYIDAFVDTVVDTVSRDLEPPYDETAVLTVSLGPVGYVETLELKSVSSTLIEAPFQLFVEAPPSLPVAPLEVRECLGAQPFPLIIKVFRRFRCEDQEAYLTYAQDIQMELYKILYSPRYSISPGRGWVRVGLTLGPEGQVRNLEFHRRSNPLASAKLRTAISQVGTFPPPPDFSRCFAEKALDLRLDVQGE